jgi:hypothetical protein
VGAIVDQVPAAAFTAGAEQPIGLLDVGLVPVQWSLTIRTKNLVRALEANAFEGSQWRRHWKPSPRAEGNCLAVPNQSLP